MIDIEKLKALASDVLQEYPDGTWYREEHLIARAVDPSAASLMAELKPFAVLELIAEVARLRREEKNDKIAYDAVLQRQHEIRAERDQLKAENEALRKDAERWRFFSVLANELQAFPHSWGQMTPEKMNFMCDQAIADVGMSKERT